MYWQDGGVEISVAKPNLPNGNVRRQKIFSLMKRDFSEYARSMRISTYGRTDSEVAQQSGWSTILEIGCDCQPPEIKNLNLFIFLFQH